MTFGQTVDAVVEKAYIEVDIATYLVDEVVATDSEAVAVASHLPNIEFGVAGLDAGSDSTSTSVDGVEAVGVEVMRHTARATNTRDHYGLVRRDTHLCHGLLQCHTDSMVTTARAKLNGLVTFE